VARRGELTLAAQAFALRQLMPDGLARLKPARLTWVGQVHPGPECARYDLCIDIGLHEPPTVRVLSPTLKPNDDGLLPHVYEDGTLCVHKPGDWRRRMLLTQTILPWACEWLLYYELWKATDVWHGDGPDHLDAESQAKILHPYS
jgi:hypothetical protein